MTFKHLIDYDKQSVRRESTTTAMMRIMKFNHENNVFATFAIVGQRGAGKSTYALRSLYELYSRIDRSITCEKLMRYIYMDPAKLVRDLTTHFERTVQNCRNRSECIVKNRIPAVLLDDAGLFFSRYLWFENRAGMIALHKLLQPVRLIVSNFIITAPALEDVVAVLRNSPDTYLIVVERLKNSSVVRLYDIPRLLPRKLRVKRFLRDVEIIKLDAPCYDTYHRIRQELTARSLAEASVMFNRVEDFAKLEIPVEQLAESPAGQSGAGKKSGV